MYSLMNICISIYLCSYSSDPENISRIPDGVGVAFIFDSQHFEYQVPWLVCGITRIGIITAVPGISKSLDWNKNSSSYRLTM